MDTQHGRDAAAREDDVAAVQRALDRASTAAAVLPRLAPQLRARALDAAADALDAAADELLPLAAQETGLADGRLRGELRRTSVQLRLFADVVAAGEYLDVRLDAADADFVLGPRPDLRRYLAPVGVVLNFAASNFPFAFSVAGGDTAAALAAGCAVVVKAHHGHPLLSRRTAAVVAGALEAAGLPAGTLQVLLGHDAGVTALRDPRVAAASFTGSFAGGTALARIAAERPVPIPFYGELGSVNPVFATAAATASAQSRTDLAAAYLASVSGSAGQLCTKPGFLFVPAAAAEEVGAAAGTAAAAVPEHRLLHAGIARGYVERREAILGVDGVRVLARGTVREAEDGTWVTPTLVAAGLGTLLEHRAELLDEAFGPLSILVSYDDAAALPPLVTELFPGNLTATIQVADDDPEPALPALVTAVAQASGRVVLNGWPTGVSVTPAMEHGGPFPATTQGGTSVGTAAITRFLRGVSFQNVPAALLPEPLQDANPWGVPQRRSPAGASATWGSGARQG